MTLVVSTDNDLAFEEVAGAWAFLERQGLTIERVQITLDLHPTLLKWPEHFEGEASMLNVARGIYGRLWGIEVHRMSADHRTMFLVASGAAPSDWNVRQPPPEGSGKTVWDRL